jgi:hypothetical protein
MQPERLFCAKMLKRKAFIAPTNLKSQLRQRGRVRRRAAGTRRDTLVSVHALTPLSVQRFLVARTSVLNRQYVIAQS